MADGRVAGLEIGVGRVAGLETGVGRVVWESGDLGKGLLGHSGAEKGTYQGLKKAAKDLVLDHLDLAGVYQRKFLSIVNWG